MTETQTRTGMTNLIMQPAVIYTRESLTKLFWVSYPAYCAKLLMNSPVTDRTPLDVLKGIIRFDEFKRGQNIYEKV